MEGDELGRQGGSGVATKPRFRESVTQSWRSKNPYSFQLSGEKTKKSNHSLTYPSWTPLQSESLKSFSFCLASDDTKSFLKLPRLTLRPKCSEFQPVRNGPRAKPCRPQKTTNFSTQTLRPKTIELLDLLSPTRD